MRMRQGTNADERLLALACGRAHALGSLAGRAERNGLRRRVQRRSVQPEEVRGMPRCPFTQKVGHYLADEGSELEAVTGAGGNEDDSAGAHESDCKMPIPRVRVHA